MSHEFGPDSSNPRLRRAYAHTMIAKLATRRANFGEASDAAYNASLTRKGSRSGFESALFNASDKATKVEKGTSSHRGIRRVPLNWEHPRDDKGYYIPLFDPTGCSGGRYNFEEIEELIEDGSIKPGESRKDWFMPAFGDVPQEEMGICLYETTTEGTPLTPVYPDTPQGRKDLSAYAAEYATRFGSSMSSAQEWEDRLFGEISVTYI